MAVRAHTLVSLGVFAVVLLGGGVPLAGDVTGSSREWAAIEFAQPTKVGASVLLGSYIVEHDSDRMARGLPCTAIYEHGSWPLKGVVSFHCRPMGRKTVDKFTMSLRRRPDLGAAGMELIDYQFAGSGEAHGVPGLK